MTFRRLRTHWRSVALLRLACSSRIACLVEPALSAYERHRAEFTEPGLAAIGTGVMIPIDVEAVAADLGTDADTGVGTPVLPPRPTLRRGTATRVAS
jgi:hypothetical protein